MAQVPHNIYQQLVDLSSYHNGEVWMRIEDTLLEPTEAEAVTSLMYQLAKPYVDWTFPDREIHLTRTKYHTDPQDYERQPEYETEEEYNERLVRLREAPSRNATSDEQWLRRACIVNGVLNLLHTAYGGNYSRLETNSTSFDPKRFFEYFWICLKGGQGVRAWDYKPASRPKMPRAEWSYRQCGRWCCQEANKAEKLVLKKWHEGELLESLSGELTLNDMVNMSNGRTVAFLNSVSKVDKVCVLRTISQNLNRRCCSRNSLTNNVAGGVTKRRIKRRK